jgi:hypothetical protein
MTTFSRVSLALFLSAVPILAQVTTSQYDNARTGSRGEVEVYGLLK